MVIYTSRHSFQGVSRCLNRETCMSGKFYDVENERGMVILLDWTLRWKKTVKEKHVCYLKKKRLADYGVLLDSAGLTAEQWHSTRLCDFHVVRKVWDVASRDLRMCERAYRKDLIWTRDAWNDDCKWGLTLDRRRREGTWCVEVPLKRGDKKMWMIIWVVLVALPKTSEDLWQAVW